MIEILWTVVPVLILVIIAIPSFRLMYFMDRVPNAEMTIKVIGNQWYWTYAYPDQGDLTFDSNIIPEKDLKPGQKRLLDVDNPLVVPVDTNDPGADHRDRRDPQLVCSVFRGPVIRDARPRQRDLDAGRAPGHLYGECNQICGINHAFMPIKVVAVPKPEFEQWLGDAKKKFASGAPAGGAGAHQVAANPAATDARGSPGRRPARFRRQLRRQAAASGRQLTAKRSEMAYHDAPAADHAAHDSSAGLFHALAVLDQPQGHRHALPAASRSPPG